MNRIEVKTKQQKQNERAGLEAGLIVIDALLLSAFYFALPSPADSILLAIIAFKVVDVFHRWIMRGYDQDG